MCARKGARTYRSARKGEPEGTGSGPRAQPSASGRVRAVVLRREDVCCSARAGAGQSGRRRAGACTYRSARTRERSFTGRGAHAQAHVSGSAWASAWAGEELKTQVLGVRVQGIGFTVYGLRFGDEGLAGAGFSN